MEIKSLISKAIKRAEPFDSVPLDSLAETIGASSYLVSNIHRRYFRCKSLPAGAVSFKNKIKFDARFLSSLSEDELCAIGAHEFTHLRERHRAKKIQRILLPQLIVLLLAWLAVFVFAIVDVRSHFVLSKSVLIALAIVAALPALFVTALSLIILGFTNARWLRSLETTCDFAAARIGRGEELISALQKLNKLYPMKQSGILYRLAPKFYPPLETRITNIRNAR